MRTPAGKECPYYYANFHRDSHVQECRLIKGNPQSLPWRPEDCKDCPVPAVVAANASPDLRLELIIRPAFMGLGRRKSLTAFCNKHAVPIEDPYIGCARCAAERPGLDLFKQALEDTDD